MSDARVEKTRAYIRHACDMAGLSATALAKRAGIAPSTLNRFLNDDPPPSVPGNATLKKIADAAGVAPIGRYNESGSAGFSEDQAAFIGDMTRFQTTDLNHPGEALLSALGARHPHASLWQVEGDTMELKGLMGGDFAVVDLATEPETGRIVVAQLYDWHAGTAKTVFRLYDPPFLVAACRDPVKYKPELTGEKAQVKGTVLCSFRLYDSADQAPWLAP